MNQLNPITQGQENYQNKAYTVIVLIIITKSAKDNNKAIDEI